MNVNMTSPSTMYYPDKHAEPDTPNAECDWCGGNQNVSYFRPLRKNLCELCWDEAEHEQTLDF